MDRRGGSSLPRRDGAEPAGAAGAPDRGRLGRAPPALARVDAEDTYSPHSHPIGRGGFEVTQTTPLMPRTLLPSSLQTLTFKSSNLYFLKLSNEMYLPTSRSGRKDSAVWMPVSIGGEIRNDRYPSYHNVCHHRRDVFRRLSLACLERLASLWALPFYPRIPLRPTTVSARPHSNSIVPGGLDVTS